MHRGKRNKLSVGRTNSKTDSECDWLAFVPCPSISSAGATRLNTRLGISISIWPNLTKNMPIIMITRPVAKRASITPRNCGEADDVPSAIRLVNETRPHVVTIDISLKSGSGLDLIRRITKTQSIDPDGGLLAV